MTKAGGTTKAEELVIAVPLGKGKNVQKPSEVVKAIMTKWGLGKKELGKINNPGNVYIGIVAKPDEMYKKAYVSAVFGNFQSFNEGAKHKKELKVPYNTKSKKLKNPDPRKCKICDKWKDYDKLRDGLFVENGKIYLKYDNLKMLKRLLKKSTDGLAVDLIQKDQYAKTEYNIMDNNLRNKGIMQKMVNIDKITSKNLIKPDPKSKRPQKINKIKVEVGKLPKGITGAYEMNLLVIIDGYVCRTILRSYMEQGDQESSTPIDMLAMPEAVLSRVPPFEPRSESSILNFTIPFEKNKSEFKPEDIKPFIDALQEPDFIIDGLYIYAYSSIEGDSVANTKLQRKRAESVVNVLQSMQTAKITPNIITNDSWGLFQLEMEDGKFDYLTKMTKKEAIRTINSKRDVLAELEPVLAKQRFAQIVMDVTYDISGAKEQKFAVAQFNKCVKAGNVRQGYKIMDFIATKVRLGKYLPECMEQLQIPFEAKNIGYLNDMVYYDYLYNHHVVLDEHLEQLLKIQKLDPTNSIVNFNVLFSKIKLDTGAGDKTYQEDMQTQIDGFYKTDIPKKTVDGLNIEWQFKLLEAIDTTENSEAARETIIAKIKSFYNFKEATWQNALKLAFAFSRAKDFKFAAGILEPYIKQGIMEKNLVFGYISIASHVPEKFFAHSFVKALSMAKELDKEKYCTLFGDPHMSFQVLDNPKIKEEYFGSSCPSK
jgi:outer membrane protein OmpA-like peptidoglycan-associated protein